MREHAEPAGKKTLAVAVRFESFLERASPGSSWAETGRDCGACRQRGLCVARGCDGVERADPVWVDTDVELLVYTCPVLAYTPWVEEVFAWFTLLYTVEVGFGWAQWRRSTLPYEGGMADQPGKLIAALEYVAQQRNAAIAKALKRRRPKGEAKEKRG